MLEQAGDRTPYSDLGAEVVAPYLWSQGVKHIDYLVMSHPDRDHVGGFFTLIDRFSIGAVLLGPVPSGRPIEAELLTKCAAVDIPVRRVARGDSFDLDGARLDVLHPPRDWPHLDSANDASLVTRITWDRGSALLAGDIELLAEATLAQGDCKATVLKVPHHGSPTSSSLAFLAAVQPRQAIASRGTGHSRGPMAPEIADRYDRRAITLWRTDQAGGLRIFLDEAPIRAVPTHSETRPAAGPGS